MNTRFDPELSRLAFEDRLIEFCEDSGIPLLERVRLLGIAAGRLDIFFMSRIGRLKRWHAESPGAESREQLKTVAAEAKRITRRAYRLLDNELYPALREHGIRIERFDALDEAERGFLYATCGSRLGTLIHPVVVDRRNAFPHVRNLRPALMTATREAGSEARSVVVELPAELPRLVPLRDKHRFVPLEQIIAAELPALAPELNLGDSYLFRVTRNGDTDFDDAHDVLHSVEREVVNRPFQEVVRLEVEHAMPKSMREYLQRQFQNEADTPALGLGDQDTYNVKGLVDLTALDEIAAIDLPALKGEPIAHRPVHIDSHLLEAGSAEGSLLHFPFDDYATSLERFLGEAADHPDLESLQTTIYRTDKHSGVVAALLAARSRGADVSAVVELKASFDERDNIALARELEAAGVHVILSPPSLKVHAKMALVTLRTGDAVRRVALIGTGNMNAVTARSYIDLWLVTSQPSCTNEIAALFDVLGGRAQDVEFDCILVAPFDMRRRFLDLIERETAHAMEGRPSGIRAMINGLSDPAIITALYRASQAGVPIDLAVRGLCKLRPGELDISGNIRIVSIAGHLLQHARIFHFRNAGRDAFFIGSADWRPRNLDGRIEVVTSVTQPEHVTLLDRVLTETLDTRDAWVLGSDGVYVRRTTAVRSPDQGSRTYVTLTPS